MDDIEKIRQIAEAMIRECQRQTQCANCKTPIESTECFKDLDIPVLCERCSKLIKLIGDNNGTYQT